MSNVVGYCSKCGGEVVSFPVQGPNWVKSTTPTCTKCGAKSKKNLPVIEMNEGTGQQLLQE